MSNFFEIVKVTTDSGNFTKVVKIANASEIGNAVSVDTLPDASDSLKGMIYYLTTDNKYYVVNAAGDDWEDIAVSDEVPDHDHLGVDGDGGVIGDTAATVDRLVLRTDEGTAAVQALDIDTTAPDLSETHTPGRIRWNGLDGTIEVDTAFTDVTYQLGQETSVKVQNDSGVDIANGEVVRISGSSGQRIRVSKAQANSAANLDGTIGVATMAIADGDMGIVTTRGLVRGLNTNDYTAGDNLWVSPTTAGAFTKDEPTAPNLRCRVGVVAIKNNGNGAVYVSPDNQVELDEHIQQTYTAHSAIDVGADYLHGVESIGAVTFDDTSHVLTVAAATNTYWFKGARYSTAGAITCDLDDFVTLTENTLYYVYFDDATGALKANDAFWDLREKVPVALVWWNGTAGAPGKEWHGHRRDIDTQIWAHLTIGARYYSGYALTLPNAANDDSLQIEDGKIYDEDLLNSHGQQTTCRYVYQASSGVYTWALGAYPYVGTVGQPQFLRTTDYTLQDVAANDFVCYWVYASNDLLRPIYIVPTQAASEYNTIALARQETPPVLAGLNITPEIRLLYRIIYKGDGGFQEAADYRTVSSLPAGSVSVTVIPDHDHSGDAGDGGTFDAGNLTAGASTDGQVLTSDGAGGAAWESLALANISDAGTIASQAANSVDIDGGAIDGTTIGANSAAAGTFTNVTGTNIISKTVQIADDGVTTVTAFIGFVFISDSGSQYRVLFCFTNSLEAVASAGSSQWVINATQGTLTGTTGVDGEKTLRMNNGTLYIENRTGGAIDVRIAVIGSSA